MKIKKLNESMRPSQETLDDCLQDYLNNAFGYNGVEDYVDTQYPMHPQEFKAEVVNYIKERKNESLSEDIEHCWFGYYLDIKGNKKYFYMTKDSTSKDPDEASDIMEDSIPEPFTKFVFQGSVANTQAERQGMKLIESTLTEVVEPQPNGYHNIWPITDTIIVHNDGGVYHVVEKRDNNNKYIFNTENLEELNSYLSTNYGETIVDPEPKEKPVEEPKKRYPLHMWKTIEDAVAGMTNIPDEHKEAFISLVGDRATTKRIPRVGWKSSLLPAKLRAKYGERANYNHLILNPEYFNTTLEQALTDIYDTMKTKWFNESLLESIEVETVADYIVNHYDFDDIEDKYSCINSIRDSFKGQKTISKEELEQFIGAHNGKDKMNEASYGGAFDIADDQIFTREDIDDLAEEVLNHINETYEYKFDISAAYIDGNELEVGVENDELGEYVTTLKIDMRKVREPWHLKRVYAFEVASDLINQISTSLNDLGESLTESATEGAKPIETGAAVGMAAVLSDLIKDEYEAIEGYNSAIATAEAEGYGDMVKVLTDIQAEENIHIGQLQELMKMVDPNAHKIEDGYAEAAEELSNPIDDDVIDDDDALVLVTEDVDCNDDIADEDVDELIRKVEEAMNTPVVKDDVPTLIDEFEDDEIIVESTEPWEDIYKSFKDIEFQLNGDGEAITATIDRIYQDNKDNPDFEKAYQKWASNE